MLILYVDDADCSGEGPLWEKALTHVRTDATLGKEEYDPFTFLGRQFQHNSDCANTLHHTDHVNALERAYITKERRSRPGDNLTEKETPDYRSIVGQIAWPARATLPRLSYPVSDRQQTIELATVGYLIHAHNILSLAKTLVLNGHTLQFQHIDQDLCLGAPLAEQYNKNVVQHPTKDMFAWNADSA